jgi:hypothetical protein
MASIAIRRKSCENFVSARDFEVVLGRKTRPFTFNLDSAKFSLSHAAISAPQLLDCEALLASL